MIIDINEKVRDIFGYSKAELIGKNFRCLFKYLTKKSKVTITKNFVRRMLGISIPPYEVDIYRSNGELANIEITATPVEKDGKIIGSLAFLKDITSHRKAEEALKQQKALNDRILENSPSAILVIDNNGKILLANQTFYRDFEYWGSNVSNKSIFRIIKVKEFQEVVSNVLKNKEDVLTTEFSYDLDNIRKVITADIVKMQDNQYLIFLNDETEERIKQQKLYLTDRLVSIGEMTSGVAHELNNPLTSIITLSQLLQDNDLGDAINQDLLDIHCEAKRAAKIVDNILKFSRQNTEDKENIQVSSLVDDVLKLRSHEHQSHSIEVVTHIPHDLPYVYADRFQLQQVILNIILNAEAAILEAQDKGLIHITAEKKQDCILLSISDNGPGIKDEHLGRIFDPFFTTKDIGKGTGLGLSICFGIISRQGGKIYANSKYGEGATFFIELPFVNDNHILAC
jgi:two-component system NtrC family sensor kinase